MSNTVEQIKQHFEEFLSEDAKFSSGNGAAGTRARKALAELSKAIKVRRNEITEEKNARKEAKASSKA
jgi:Histone H1-like protein Hc1